MTDRERLLWTIKANSALENPEVLLAALEADGYAWYRPEECEPWLGCATTRQLIEELTARIDVLGQLDYSTVGGTPDGRP